MKKKLSKKTIIIIIICVLVALVIALCVFGVIGPQGSTPIASLAGYFVRPAPSCP